MFGACAFGVTYFAGVPLVATSPEPLAVNQSVPLSISLITNDIPRITSVTIV